MTVVADSIAQLPARPFAHSSQTQKRLALVIGIDRYPNLPSDHQLQKAVNDARGVKSTLVDLDFEVHEGINLGQRDMVHAIDSVTAQIEPGDTMFFFFAGHGIEIKGQNWLLPGDVPPAEEGHETLIKGSSLLAIDIIQIFREKGARLVVAVLDACRNNPFNQPGGRSLKFGRGLARMEAVEGTFILYSAAANQEARDSLHGDDKDPNSVFTRVLLPQLKQPNLTLVDLAKTVQQEVYNLAMTVGHKQEPAYYDGVRGHIVFTGIAAQTRRDPVIQSPVPLEGRLKIGARIYENEKFPFFLPGAGRNEWFQDHEIASKMLVIPDGTMICGARAGESHDFSDEYPAHEVRISRPFALGRAPITVAQWKEYATAKKLKQPVGAYNTPIVAVTWYEACAYTEWLTEMTGEKYRLPTEAEWEYAARGGRSGTLFCWGDRITPNDANYDSTRSFEDSPIEKSSKGIVPVEQGTQNAFGLCDMLGNVWEWTADSYNRYPLEPSDGSAVILDEKTECRAVARGGSWNSEPRYLRCASRLAWTKTESARHIGFRVAREI